MNNGSQTWFAVDVTVDPLASEAVEHAFNVCGTLGTEINDFRKDKAEEICVVGYFDDEPENAAITAAIEESIRIYGLTADTVKSTAVRKVKNTDWLAEWKKHWKPTKVGKFVITPPWSTVGENNAIVIRIEPNMAFGTGTHETTQLCLQAIGENYREGQTFLDVGTGTGILAIAAAKMFDRPKKLEAYDTDADAVAIAKENAALNGVAKKIEFRHGPITNETPAFDFVCANLTLDVIVPVLHLLLEKTRRTLVLSGILSEQKEIISSELNKFQISNFNFQIKGEWISVVIMKK